MILLSADETQAVDKNLIASLKIPSYELVGMAANALYLTINHLLPNSKNYVVFCGPGNNGADGLAVARILRYYGKPAMVYIFKGKYSDAFLKEKEKLTKSFHKFVEIRSEADFPAFDKKMNVVVIDALFGIGLSRKLDGLASNLVSKINEWNQFTIAIDLPSGLSPDFTFKSDENNTIKADLTLTIHQPKLAFLFPENEPFVGDFKVIDIGLNAGHIKVQNPKFQLIDADFIHSTIRYRPKFGHKGTFGHSLVIAGSQGKFGAAVLASKAALKSGCGKLSAAIPDQAVSIVLNHLPEALITPIQELEQNPNFDFTIFNAIAFGPGVGLSQIELKILESLLHQHNKPLVIDADGITLLSQNHYLLALLRPHHILTPHPAEFDRLTEIHHSSWDRFLTQLRFAKENQVIVVLKGHYTSIALPNGQACFNLNGNNGMATAGSGDVLTGILVSLLAQGYSAEEAAILGVYLHGFAGDQAAEKQSKSAMLATDIIDGISNFYKIYEKPQTL
jgi:NAD(P)H-hydrate epimerase